MEKISSLMLKWYDCGHRDLPWRGTTDPYRIWISEIMLQQTRTETVSEYYRRFISLFPTVCDLAYAPEQDVLKAWEGLGYYSRARNLHKCAKVICCAGDFPKTAAELSLLPGIGPYTAGAIASFAFGEQVPAVDGNVERVICRLCGIREDVALTPVKKRIREEAAKLVPSHRAGDFNQSMIELGACVCKPGTPDCFTCPVAHLCSAYALGDADRLPIHAKKPAQREIQRGTALVLRGNRVLVFQRSEALLHGLWCFPGFDNAETLDDVVQALAKQGLFPHFVREAGTARHVFTHIIWNMNLFVFEDSGDFTPEGGRWVTLEEWEQLPHPTAMRGAEEALRKAL